MVRVRCPHCAQLEDRAQDRVVYHCTNCGFRLRVGGPPLPVPADLQVEEAEAHPESVRTTLVQLDAEGTFLVLGDERLPGLDFTPIPYVDLEHGPGAHTAAQAIGLANVAAQGLSGLQQAQGLVRLAPETLAALRAGAAPLTQGGWNLGGLQVGGKLVATVRWAPVGAAGAVGLLAAVGPALAVMAVQWQLRKIAKRVERNITLTTRVLDELRNESWHDLKATVSTVLEEANHVMSMGLVTLGIWDHLQSQSVVPSLARQRSLHLEALSKRQLRFSSLNSDKQRKAWMEDDFSELLRNAHAVAAAEQAWLIYQLIRAAHLRSTGQMEDEVLAERVMARAIETHRETEELLHSALRGLHDSLSLLLEANPDHELKIGKQKIPVREIRQSVENVHAAAADGAFKSMPLLGERAVHGAGRSFDVSADKRNNYLRRLRWLLREGETIKLLARADVDIDGWGSRCLVVVTDDRLLLTDRKALMEGLPIGRELPLAELRVARGPTAGERERIKITVGSVAGELLVKSGQPADAYTTIKLAVHSAKATPPQAVDRPAG